MHTRTKGERRTRVRTAASVVLTLSVGLAGCGGGEDTDARVEAAANVNSAAQIAQTSADSYDDNVNGLITGNTLKGWLDDWEANRPEGVTGRLIILQADEGAAGYEYIAPVAQSVFTYEASEWTQDRSNGVVTTTTMVPDGPTMDAFLKKYDIDPARDMVVCSMGDGGTGTAMRQGRCWYMFRYWGTDKRNLAILNGDNQWQFDSGQLDDASYFTDTPSDPPETGRASVRDLPADNTALQATIGDLMDAIDPNGGRKDGVMIWDARGVNQYSAGERVESGCGAGEVNCAPPAGFDYMTTFQNAGSRQGHPLGALQLEFTNMLDGTKGYSYKDKAVLESYLNGELVDDKGFVDGTYQPVGTGNAYREGDTIYTYCETTMRAMVTGMVSTVILGKPTRFYDGAMKEWNSLSNIVTSQGTPLLPEDSPWRTDKSHLSYFKVADSAAKVGPRPVDDPYAPHTNAIVNEDRAYKFGSGSGDSGGDDGGGVAPPANPCGG